MLLPRQKAYPGNVADWRHGYLGESGSHLYGWPGQGTKPEGRTTRTYKNAARIEATLCPYGADYQIASGQINA